MYYHNQHVTSHNIGKLRKSIQTEGLHHVKKYTYLYCRCNIYIPYDSIPYQTANIIKYFLVFLVIPDAELWPVLSYGCESTGITCKDSVAASHHISLMEKICVLLAWSAS